MICASVILARCNLHNACYILEDATYYHIEPLVERLQEYIATNMEAFLETHLLDDISDPLIKQLAQFIKIRQLEKSPFTRSDSFVNQLLTKHAGWLAGLVLPGNIVRTASEEPFKADGIPVITTPKPPLAMKPSSQISGNTLRRSPSGDDIFIMDEPEKSGHPSSYKGPHVLASSQFLSPIWKHISTPRYVNSPSFEPFTDFRFSVDMKKIMAETQAASKIMLPPSQPSQPLTTGSAPQLSREFSTELKSLIAPQLSPPRRTSSGMPSARSSVNTSLGASASTSVKNTIRVPPVTLRGPGLGPVIIPKRQSQNTIPSNIQKGGR